MKTWTQQEIASEVARTSGVAGDTVNKVLSVLLGALTEGLKAGKEVIWRDFGKISVTGRQGGQAQIPGADGGQALSAKGGVNASDLDKVCAKLRALPDGEVGPIHRQILSGIEHDFPPPLQPDDEPLTREVLDRARSEDIE